MVLIIPYRSTRKTIEVSFLPQSLHAREPEQDHAHDNRRNPDVWKRLLYGF
jgi:hypothetical protein